MNRSGGLDERHAIGQVASLTPRVCVEASVLRVVSASGEHVALSVRTQCWCPFPTKSCGSEGQMDGWVVSVPLLRLSEVDQQFIHDHSPYLLTSTIISPAVRACERRSGDERGFRARSPENDPAWVGGGCGVPRMNAWAGGTICIAIRGPCQNRRQPCRDPKEPGAS